MAILFNTILFARASAAAPPTPIELRLDTSATLVDSSGKQRRLADELGTITVISFWATFCQPCLEELPYLEELAAKYKGDRNVRVLAISIDPMKDAAERSKSTAKKLGLSNLTVLTDVDRQLTLQLSHGDPTHLPPIPLLVVVGRDGLVRHQERGFKIQGKTRFVEDHRRVIESLLHPRAGSAGATH